jgi:hypothetical protein
VTLEGLSDGQILFGLAVAAILSIGVYYHALRRQNRYATLWGVAVFLVPAVSLIYAYRTWSARRGRRR